MRNHAPVESQLLPVVYLSMRKNLDSFCLLAGFRSYPKEVESSPFHENQHPKIVVSNRNLLFHSSIFRGELLVSGRVLPKEVFHHPFIYEPQVVYDLTMFHLSVL